MPRKTARKPVKNSTILTAFNKHRRAGKTRMEAMSGLSIRHNMDVKAIDSILRYYGK